MEQKALEEPEDQLGLQETLVLQPAPTQWVSLDLLEVLGLLALLDLQVCQVPLVLLASLVNLGLLEFQDLMETLDPLDLLDPLGVLGHPGPLAIREKVNQAGQVFQVLQVPLVLLVGQESQGNQELVCQDLQVKEENQEALCQTQGHSLLDLQDLLDQWDQRVQKANQVSQVKGELTENQVSQVYQGALDLLDNLEEDFQAKRDQEDLVALQGLQVSLGPKALKDRLDHRVHLVVAQELSKGHLVPRVHLVPQVVQVMVPVVQMFGNRLQTFFRVSAERLHSPYTSMVPLAHLDPQETAQVDSPPGAPGTVSINDIISLLQRDEVRRYVVGPPGRGSAGSFNTQEVAGRVMTLLNELSIYYFQNGVLVKQLDALAPLAPLGLQANLAQEFKALLALQEIPPQALAQALGWKKFGTTYGQSRVGGLARGPDSNGVLAVTRLGLETPPSEVPCRDLSHETTGCPQDDLAEMGSVAPLGLLAPLGPLVHHRLGGDLCLMQTAKADSKSVQSSRSDNMRSLVSGRPGSPGPPGPPGQKGERGDSGQSQATGYAHGRRVPEAIDYSNVALKTRACYGMSSRATPIPALSRDPQGPQDPLGLKETVDMAPVLVSQGGQEREGNLDLKEKKVMQDNQYTQDTKEASKDIKVQKEPDGYRKDGPMATSGGGHQALLTKRSVNSMQVVQDDQYTQDTKEASKDIKVQKVVQDDQYTQDTKEASKDIKVQKVMQDNQFTQDTRKATKDIKVQKEPDGYRKDGPMATSGGGHQALLTKRSVNSMQVVQDDQYTQDTKEASKDIKVQKVVQDDQYTQDTKEASKDIKVQKESYFMYRGRDGALALKGKA
ncbi:hypothetical protein JZ751_026865 [Albula glossodonta]|uniref:Uncharacterized protein n=1 Tax=Albula glossodonta TaxID=121402 RepID=A0A8T2PE62_9TELE|nr:hypothetical protein JZ751_026865 [Albula glossodonta]